MGNGADRIAELEAKLGRELTAAEDALVTQLALRDREIEAYRKLGRALLVFIEKHEEIRHGDERGLVIWGMTEADRAELLHQLDRLRL